MKERNRELRGRIIFRRCAIRPRSIASAALLKPVNADCCVCKCVAKSGRNLTNSRNAAAAIDNRFSSWVAKAARVPVIDRLLWVVAAEKLCYKPLL